MSLRIEKYSMFAKCKDIWNKYKGLLDIKFHSKSVYDEKYIKTKVQSDNILW